MIDFFITKEELERLYFEEKLSYSKIEKKLNLKRVGFIFGLRNIKLKVEVYLKE
jgi:hypothetical protein